jgi:GTP cyclohydrolase II
VTDIDLISNAHRSFVGLSGYGLTVVNERRLEP